MFQGISEKLHRVSIANDKTEKRSYGLIVLLIVRQSFESWKMSQDFEVFSAFGPDVEDVLVSIWITYLKFTGNF